MRQLFPFPEKDPSARVVSPEIASIGMTLFAAPILRAAQHGEADEPTHL